MHKMKRVKSITPEHEEEACLVEHSMYKNNTILAPHLIFFFYVPSTAATSFMDNFEGIITVHGLDVKLQSFHCCK